MPKPPAPQVTYGEFPFRLEYEIDGKGIVVEDTVICEYDGIGWNEGVGKHRKWKSSLSDGKEYIVLVEGKNAVPVREWKSDEIAVYQEIFFNPGVAGYYMGDTEQAKIYSTTFPDASYFEKYEDGSSMSGIISAKELLDRFKIKLLSWDHSQPIENSFISK
jgi:hypothetical protein